LFDVVVKIVKSNKLYPKSFGPLAQLVRAEDS